MTLLPHRHAALFVKARLALPKLACVAGEPSGDLLAAPVLSALHGLPGMSEINVYGIGGPLMQAEGLRSDWPMETLSVRGYVEAIKQHCYLLVGGRADLKERIFDLLALAPKGRGP